MIHRGRRFGSWSSLSASIFFSPVMATPTLNLALVLFIGAFLRAFCVLSDVGEVIASSPEIVTPHNDFSASTLLVLSLISVSAAYCAIGFSSFLFPVLEGVFLSKQGLSPYSSSSFAASPLYVALFSSFFWLSDYIDWIMIGIAHFSFPILIHVALDLAVGVLLFFLGTIYLSSMKIEGKDSSWEHSMLPVWVSAAYLLNPFNLLSSVARTVNAVPYLRSFSSSLVFS